jgi:hypothetical protein
MKLALAHSLLYGGKAGVLNHICPKLWNLVKSYLNVNPDYIASWLHELVKLNCSSEN